jgi:addiction module RelB/DinJ family antitoxin
MQNMIYCQQTITKGVIIMSVQISTRIDEATKQQFDKVCEKIGISPSNAISMFIKGVINNNGIPFNVVAPPEQSPKMTKESMFGCMRGKMWMAEDFDAPLDDFREYME